MWNPDNPVWAHTLAALDEAANKLGITIQRLEVRRAEDLHGAFSRAVADRANALHFVREALFIANRAEISDHAVKSRLAIYGQRGIVAAGGLISYDADFGVMIRRTAIYVNKILKGEKQSAGGAADQVRAGDQPEDRQGARSGRAANAARSRRRGD